MVMARAIGFLIDVLTLPHTLLQKRKERTTREIHLTVKEILWLKVYQKWFFYDHPHELWNFLKLAFENYPSTGNPDHGGVK